MTLHTLRRKLNVLIYGESFEDERGNFIHPSRVTPAQSLCQKCGQPKPRIDSSPCYACVSRNVKEAERVHLAMANPPEYVI